jgi:hypothetical protein
MIWVMAVDKCEAAQAAGNLVIYRPNFPTRRRIVHETRPAGPYPMSGITMESWLVRLRLCP